MGEWKKRLLAVFLSLWSVSAVWGKVGQKVSLSELFGERAGRTATVVVFLGVGCPVANTYLPRLNQFSTKYTTRGVKIVGVNSNLQDSKEAVEKHAKEYGIRFASLKDERHRIADALSAQRTPEVVLIDAKGAIRYQGRIDDQYGVTGRRDKPSRNDLTVALEEVLAGKPVSKPTTEVEGCIIGRG